jgi:hypothetical protein
MTIARSRGCAVVHATLFIISSLYTNIGDNHDTSDVRRKITRNLQLSNLYVYNKEQKRLRTASPVKEAPGCIIM